MTKAAIQGLGVPKSELESAKWYLDAAAGGHTGAQSKLAEMYEAGDVIQQNLIRAHSWYQVATLLGESDALAKRDKVAQSMDAQGLTTAQSFALKMMQLLGSKAVPIPAVHTGGQVLKSTDVRNISITLPPMVPATNPPVAVTAQPVPEVKTVTQPLNTVPTLPTTTAKVISPDPSAPAEPVIKIKAPYIREKQSFVIPVLNLEMVWINAGKFTMGTPERDGKTSRPGEARHEVRISKGYWLGKFEVTNAQYSKLTGADVEGEDKWPVVNLSWNQAHDYCKMLQASFGTPSFLPEGYSFQLPTEAQWEYACKAGTKTEYHFGDEFSSDMANVGSKRKAKRKDSSLMDVGSYDPNPWGLHDMHGNAMEYVNDWWGHYPAGSSNVTDTLGADNGTQKLTRGGSWRSKTSHCRSSTRSRVDDLDSPMKNAGLRVVLAPTR